MKIAKLIRGLLPLLLIGSLTIAQTETQQYEVEIDKTDMKSIRKKIFKYKKQGGGRKEGFKNDSLFLYNNNNLIETYIYNSKGAVNRKIKNDYDSLNKLSEKSIYTVYTDREALVKKTIYEYNTNGNPNKETTYKGNGSFDFEWTFHYDKKGILTEKFYKGKQRLTEKLNYYYDKNGNKIKTVLYRGRSISGSAKFKYDNKGRLIEKSIYSGKAKKKNYRGEFNIKYDSNSNEIERLFYKQNGVLYEKWVMKIDEKNRKIEHLIFGFEEKFGKIEEYIAQRTTFEYQDN
jgi:hypothetical protein